MLVGKMTTRKEQGAFAEKPMRANRPVLRDLRSMVCDYNEQERGDLVPRIFFTSQHGEVVQIDGRVSQLVREHEKQGTGCHLLLCVSISSCLTHDAIKYFLGQFIADDNCDLVAIIKCV